MSKLPNVGTTIFTTMSQLAQQYDAINLAQGFPNFPVDPVLIDILKTKSTQNVHQYMPMAGDPELKIKIGQLIKQEYGRSIDSDNELLITAGATQGIFTTIMALISKGEEVIILDPAYDCYEPAVILSGGKPVRVPLKNDFLPDWEGIERAVSKQTKMLIINNPHNPSGRIWSEDDFHQLEKILTQNPDVLLLSDEVYEFITFEQKHISINSRTSLIDRTIIVSSFGKTFHITGWKIGYLVASERLMKEIKKVHQFNVFCVNSLAQTTLADYLDHVDVGLLGGFYKEKRDLFASLLKNSRLRILPSDGTYFQTVDFSAVSTMNDVEFCKHLTIEHGVAAIPISVFNADERDNKMIRFCFAKDNDTIIQATEKLCRI